MTIMGEYDLFVYAYENNREEIAVTVDEIKEGQLRTLGLRYIRTYHYDTLQQREDARAIAMLNEKGREETLSVLEKMAG